MSEDRDVARWLRETIGRWRPDSVLFNGDTFELPLRLRSVPAECNDQAVLSKILETQSEILSAVKDQPSVQQIVFLRGDHDHSLDEKSRDVLSKFFGTRDVQVGDIAFHEASRALVLHGNHFDYNLANVLVDSRTLTDELTSLFETYIHSSHPGAADLLASVVAGEFSLWYANGRLPQYLKVTEEIFSYDSRQYVEGLWKFLRGRFFSIWRHRLPNLSNRVMAWVFHRIAGLPSRPIWWLASAWFIIADWIFARRAKQLLRGRPPKGLVELHGPIDAKCLVLSHAHKSLRLSTWHRGERKNAYVTVTPRWHVESFLKGSLNLVREAAVVVIHNSGGAHFVDSTERRTVVLRPGLQNGRQRRAS